MTSILITGGHSGIGLAAARVLAAQGIELVLRVAAWNACNRSSTS
ncbi:hypothetical protein [Saccharopolyspora gregorii]